jgi:hypothetical protein
LVVLDACRTGNYASLLEKGAIIGGGLEGLVSDPDWRVALHASSTGPRVLTATDRTQTTGQGRVLPTHGDLTGALLVAARETPADVLVGQTYFVSDAAWYDGARRVLAQRGLDRGARRVGAGAVFPIVRAEATAPLGSVRVLRGLLVDGGSSIRLDLQATGRRFVETGVRATVTSSLTGAVGEFSACWTPQASSSIEPIVCDIRGCFADCMHQSWGRHGFDLSTVIHVGDCHGRSLAYEELAWHDLRYVA